MAQGTSFQKIVQIEKWCEDLEEAIYNHNTERIESILSSLITTTDSVSNPLKLALQLQPKQRYLSISDIYYSIKKIPTINTIDIVKILLNSNCPFPLIVALGDLDVCELALKLGADVNERCDDGYDMNRTALHKAVVYNDVDLVELLLKYGASVHAKNGIDYTPLHEIRHNGYEVAKLLIDNGARVDDVARSDITPLQHAYMFGELRLIRYMQEEIKTKFSKLTLHWSLHNLRDKKVFDYVLNHNSVDLNAFDDNGKTALHVATDYEYFDKVKKLLIRGANCNLKDKRGNIPLHYAVKLERYVELAILFIEFGANVNALNFKRQSVLKVAKNGWEYVIIAQIAKLNIQNLHINISDINHIRMHRRFNDFYNLCIRQLEGMRDYKFYGDISLFEILTVKSNTVAFYARNDELVNSFNEINCICKFSIYYMYVKNRFRKEVTKQTLVKNTEIVLNGIFQPVFMSGVIVRELVKYLSEKDMLKITSFL